LSHELKGRGDCANRAKRDLDDHLLSPLKRSRQEAERFSPLLTEPSAQVETDQEVLQAQERSIAEKQS
jgi:hypothetical protein